MVESKCSPNSPNIIIKIIVRDQSIKVYNMTNKLIKYSNYFNIIDQHSSI